MQALFLQNVGNYLSSDLASRPRRLESSETLVGSCECMIDEDYSLLGRVAILIGNVTDVLEELPASIFRVIKEGQCHILED
jgi:hypothetical protein